jgi:hypothetical protein
MSSRKPSGSGRLVSPAEFHQHVTCFEMALQAGRSYVPDPKPRKRSGRVALVERRQLPLGI